jgi:hypothetical protein
MLLPALPVPFIAVVPVKVRFSTLVGRVVVTEAVRVSLIVVVTLVRVPKLAFVGDVRVRVKVSFTSLIESFRMGMLID